MAYIAHVVTGVWCGEVDICDARVFLSVIPTMSAALALGNMKIRCHLNAFIKNSIDSIEVIH